MRTISITDFAALYDADTTVIDVREPAEYVEGHVPGAMLIPLAQLPARKAEVANDGPVYVICRSGNRSKVGASVLDAAGYDAVSVDGGTMAWISRGQRYVTGREAR